MADENLPTPQNQDQDEEQDVAMADSAGDGAPHGGQEQGSQPDQEPLPNPEALGLGQQEGQQPESPTYLNAMKGNVPPNSLKDWSASASSKDWVSV